MRARGAWRSSTGAWEPRGHWGVEQGTHLLVDEPQRVLDVGVLEGDGRCGALKELHEQAVDEPDRGEGHTAQL